MTRPRVPETDRGIEGEPAVAFYDRMQRRLRDRGWLETSALLRHGINHGRALEVGPGPGHLGLEWLEHTNGTTLTGVDISADMIAVAERNAADSGLSRRVVYVRADACALPFPDDAFDAVFSAGSLHEWADPGGTLREAWRVLRPGGAFLVADFRRDMLAPMRWFLRMNARPPEVRPGLDSSIAAAYTPVELREMVQGTPLWGCTVSGGPLGLMLAGAK